MITIGIASIPAREKGLELVLDSLAKRADNINLVLNGYEEVPQFLNKYENVWWWVDDNSSGDAMKFAMVDVADGYYLSCDDDLVYPWEYVRYMKNKCDEYGCIVTLHGKRYDGKRPVKSYMRDMTTNVHCLRDWDRDIEVHVGGTGCMCFHTDFFKIALSDFKYKNMADLQLALVAKRQRVKIIALAHPKDYLEYIDQRDNTIWRKSGGEDKIQTKILNEILQ
jgi:hypothetical protein